MKIAFFEMEGWEREYIEKNLKGNSISFFNQPLTSDNVKKIRDFSAVAIAIRSRIDAKILDELPNVKLIATKSTGFDHIDISECRKRGITVCNVPTYGENTVAEHTFALILSLSRNIHKAYVKSMKNDFSLDNLKGFDLKGKTLGVIGAGHIGLHVIRIAKAFGMKVLAFDISRNNFLSEVLGFEYAPMEYVLKSSDIITLHVPYNKFTHHLINKDTIKKVKKGAILINTSRGAVVDTEVLIKALDDKTISGAGLDVLEGEELITEEKALLNSGSKDSSFESSALRNNRILIAKDNVVFTPHIAFYSGEALKRILETTVESIKSFSKGKIENSIQ
ncbi:MAG: hydroxyacid dehydrogenase [Candidatus Woesearchaeota archaeon]|nr:hydroxyacid dehydrogenase [Candidatus Woesearchaeota archaeon]